MEKEEEQKPEKRKKRITRPPKLLARKAVLGIEEDSGTAELDERATELYDESFRNVAEGSVVSGHVIHVGQGHALVDVGYKSEGSIPLGEFAKPADVKVGDTVEVLIEEAEDQEGMVVLSKRKAERIKNWENIVEAYAAGRVVEGRIAGRVKGGYSVDMGMEAFLPASQVTERPSGNLDRFIGKTFPFKVIKMNRRRRNVVVSHRAVLEEEREKGKTKVLSELEKGQLRKGQVRSITDFGAFVDLGGIDGLLHVTDMSWGRVSHPSEIVAVGQEIEVKVLNFSLETQKISLGLKQKTPSPWENVEEKFPVGSKQTGRVVNITEYGAFVELEKGLEGLVHISEMSWTRRLGHPTELVAIGDVVEIVVLNIDKGKEKISLGMKQVEPNPWTLVGEKYPVGSRVKGKIRNLTDYGAFLELERGIDGFIHISDLSWSGKTKHPSEIVHKGDRVEAVVLKIDPGQKRISLGLKQLQDDPWVNVGDRYHAGDTVKGVVTKLVSFGAFVELEEGIEGLAHISQLGGGQVEKPEDVLSVGREVAAEIIRVEPERRKIGLRIPDAGGEKEPVAQEGTAPAEPAGESPPAETPEAPPGEATGESSPEEAAGDSPAGPIETPPEEAAGESPPAETPEAPPGEAAGESPPAETPEAPPEEAAGESLPEEVAEDSPAGPPESPSEEPEKAGP